MAQPRRSEGRTQALAALGVIVLVIISAAFAMAGAGLAVLLGLVVVIGVAGWYLIKALGGRQQPLSHRGRSEGSERDEEVA